MGGAFAYAQAQAARGAADGETVAAWARRFRSYDAASGTYLGNDGARHPCPDCSDRFGEDASQPVTWAVSSLTPNWTR